MRRKYYLRGLGIGIIVTSLIFIIALTLKGGSSLSDAEIRRRAIAMGMVDKDSINSEEEGSDKDKDENVDNTGNEQALPEDEAETGEDTQDSGDEEMPGYTKPEDNTVVETITDEDGNETTVENRTGHDVTEAPDERTSPVAGDEETTDSSSGESISFTIGGGENSSTVGANLQRKGLVDSGSSFDHYMEQNGYDRVIHPGSYEIPQGSSYEDIAKIITGKR